MKLLGYLLIGIGIIDFGLSWMEVDISNSLVGGFSSFTPWIFISVGFIFKASGKSDNKAKLKDFDKS